MKINEALAPIERDNWPLIWEAVAYVLEQKYATHVERRCDLTFSKMPNLERYRLAEPEDANASFGPLLGTEELPRLDISADFADYKFARPEYYERVVVVQVKATMLDRTDYKTKELNRAVYVVRGEDAESFKFGDPKRLTKPVEASETKVVGL
jgi:hypothetical protein